MGTLLLFVKENTYEKRGKRIRLHTVPYAPKKMFLSLYFFVIPPPIVIVVCHFEVFSLFWLLYLPTSLLYLYPAPDTCSYFKYLAQTLAWVKRCASSGSAHVHTHTRDQKV